MFTVLTMLYVTSLVLSDLMTRSLYLLTAFLQSPLPRSPPLVTTNMISFSVSFFFFNSTYERDHTTFIFLCLTYHT